MTKSLPEVLRGSHTGLDKEVVVVEAGVSYLTILVESN